ncbi:hypothetical protein DFR50_13211 [Roseiarcus fermentans]|uniref:Uncharacterized protein n=1 Tax=Roseiarcus fermentans TaxID=1473586 RepID=A0A366EV06_9HYPH|nr:hypothetical protein [Roseiarcus fermentans]RBP06233.1 hypothetical protein DFR50_13211 [Roseiarcus fermentans]
MGNRFAAAAFAAASLVASEAWAGSGYLLLPDNDGRPVQASDLAGRTICWDTGVVARYGRDGRFANSDGDEAHWQVVEPGVIQIGRGYREVVVLPSGQFRVHVAKRKYNTYHFGDVCKKPVDEGEANR